MLLSIYFKMDKIYEIFLCSKDNIQAEIPDGTFKKNQIIRNPELLFATCYLLYANFVKCNGALRLMLKQVELPLSKEQFSPCSNKQLQTAVI